MTLEVEKCSLDTMYPSMVVERLVVSATVSMIEMGEAIEFGIFGDDGLFGSVFIVWSGLNRDTVTGT